MTYNTRNYGVLAQIDEISRWCRANGTPVKVFENFDGGGFCFFILEFATQEHLDAFCKHDPTHTHKWIQHDDATIEYIS